MSKIGTGSGNAQGNFACTIVPQDFGQGPDGSISLNSVPGAYLYNTAAKSWSKVARFGDDAPGGGQYGGIFGDLVLHDDNSVTLVAATTAAPAPTTLGSSKSPARVPLFGGSHALIHVAESGQQELLLKTGDMLPRTNAMIESFGLIDVVRGEHFVAQVTARRSDRLNAPQGTAVVQGRLGGSAAEPGGWPHHARRIASPGARRNAERRHGAARREHSRAADRRRRKGGDRYP